MSVTSSMELLWEVVVCFIQMQRERSASFHRTPVVCGSPFRPVFVEEYGSATRGAPSCVARKRNKDGSSRGCESRSRAIFATARLGFVFSPARNALPGILAPSGDWAPQTPTLMQWGGSGGIDFKMGPPQPRGCAILELWNFSMLAVFVSLKKIDSCLGPGVRHLWL